MLKHKLIGSLTLSVALGLTLGALTPANADIFRPSKADQIRLGKDAARDILKKYREVDDSRAARFKRVMNKLLVNLPKKDRDSWQWGFHLIESKDINAFALPGGEMFLFTGLYEKMTTDDQIAAVMGHEMAHVYREHWANQVASATKRELGLAVVLGLAKANKTWQSVAGVASGLENLRYSRGDEDQADEYGLKSMVAAGYDPHGMLDLFQILKKAGGGGGGVEFLSDHPLTDSRIKKTQERIDKMQR